MTDFICEVDEAYRSACADLPEYRGTRYCVLHSPGEDKTDDFKKILESKLEQEDYDFSGTVFPEGSSDFREFVFDGNAHFTGATFIGVANFREASFSGGTDFREASFSGEADFYSAFFGREAYFYGATFSGGTYFPEATFSGEVYFSSVSFAQETDFREASFNGGTYFDRATFSGGTYFDRATFGERAYFLGTSFGERADFSGAGFEQSVLFFETTFDSRAVVDFSHTRISKPELFSFQRTKLHANWFVNVDSIMFDFTLVEWYGLPNGPEGSLNEEIEALWERGLDSPQWLLQQACQRLASNAADRRDYQIAGEFHYWTSDITRRWGWRIKSPPEYWGNFLHWMLNGYGERPYRAFLMLLAVWGIFALLYMAAGPEEMKVLSALLALDLWESLRRGFGAVSYSLGVMVRLNPEPKATPGFFQLLVSLEGLLGPLQFAMLVLATRRYIPWLAEALGRGNSQSG